MDKFEVPIRTKIRKIASSEGSRFSLNNIQISPATVKDHVFLAGTDAKTLIVLQQPGECSETVLVAASDLPAHPGRLKTATLTRSPEGQINCEINNGRESSRVETGDGKMPRMHDVLPHLVNTGAKGEQDWVQVSLNPKLLLKWCEAAGATGDNDCVAFFVKPSNSDNSTTTSDGICALEFRNEENGIHAIGAIMPMVGENNGEQIALQRYEATRQCYIAAQTGDPDRVSEVSDVADQEMIASSVSETLDNLILQTQGTADAH